MEFERIGRRHNLEHECELELDPDAGDGHQPVVEEVLRFAGKHLGSREYGCSVSADPRGRSGTIYIEGGRGQWWVVDDAA
jgi:hypothetical protein